MSATGMAVLASIENILEDVVMLGACTTTESILTNTILAILERSV